MERQHPTEDLVPVTKQQFFAAIGALNVHPRAERERSVWEDLNTRAVLGVTTPGYANTYTAEGKTPETYLLRSSLLKATGAAS